MKRPLTILLVCLVAATALAQAPNPIAPVAGVISSAGSSCAKLNQDSSNYGPSNCVSMQLSSTVGTVSIVLSGTFSATVQFELSADLGNSWVSAGTASATSAGTYTFAAAGYNGVRARSSAYSSGSITVVITPSTSSTAGVNVTGGVTGGHCVAFIDAAHVQDSGGACGGSGSPCILTAGAVQYNNSGAFGCVADYIFTPGTHTLAGSASAVLDLSALTFSNIKFPSTTANFFLAAPNGSSGAPSPRAIVAADIPTLNQNTTGTASNLSGTPALPSGTSATEQPLGDYTAKLSPDTFVQDNGTAIQTLGATGTTVADRMNTQCIAFPGSVISALRDNVGVINDTGAVDWVNTACTLWLAGHTIYRTTAGYTQADRQSIHGSGVGNGGTSVSATTGTGINATSTFPTGQTGGGGITASGAGNTTGSSTLTVVLAAGPNNVNIGDGQELYITGDSTRYFIKRCAAGTAPPCVTSTSQFYQLVQGGAAVSLNITPTLAGTVTAGTVVKLLGVIDRDGDSSVPQGGSVQDTRVGNSFISGNSAFGGTGAAIGFLASITCQENCGFDYLRVRDAVHGVQIWGAHRSYFVGGNVSWDNASFCLTPAPGVPATIPFEIGSFSTVINGFTVFASACTPANMPFGLYHVTDNPLSTLGNGPMIFLNTHGEMCGGTGGSTGCNGTGISGDNFQIDSATGDVRILGGSSCSSGFPCQNSVHIKSSFGGTLDVDGFLVNGATNWIQDDKNSNTIAAAAVANGSGRYRIDNSGGADTDLPCTGTGITWANGWCGQGPARLHYTSGSIDDGFNTSKNLIANGATFTGITGSTQCLQVNSSGVLSGTGSACGAGGGGLSGQNVGGVPIAATSTTSTSSTTPGTNQGVYNVGRSNSTHGTAATLTEQQVGDCASPTTITGSATTGTIVYTDVVGCTIVHDIAASAGATITIPTPTTLDNAHPIFVYRNDSGSSDTLSPTTFQISLGNSAAASTLTVPSNASCKVQLDPTNASTWKADCHPVTNKQVVGSGVAIPTGPASFGANDVALGGADGHLIDSGVVGTNVVTQTSNASSGQVCTYTGTNKVCVPATALPSGVTATTQTAGDNSTKVATTAYVDSVPKVRALAFNFGAPEGSALSTNLVRYMTVPFACTITGWDISADSGTATIKFWKIATGTALPTVSNVISTSGVQLTTGTTVRSSTTSDFTTTTVTAGDIIAATNTATSAAKFLQAELECTTQ